MAASEFLKNYELVESTIKKLYDSKLRLAILDALKEKPMRLADLRNAVNANAPNTSSKAKELEDMGLVERMEGDYQLTPYGRAIVQRMSESLQFYATYEKFKEFWETHDTSGIPDFLWARLGDLEDSRLVTVDEGDMTAIHNTFMELLKSVQKSFCGVSPAYHKEWWAMLVSLAKKGVDTHIIVTSEIIRMCIKNAGGNQIKELDSCSNAHFGLCQENLKVAFTVCESFLAMGLNDKGGRYTMDMDLQSTSPRAIQWGLDLFEYYRKQAKPVKLSDFL
ncbi:MAG: winged helix-turn-helix domain-containing protein [Candidatus Altiarchaeota archaeon]|nr:winged helix-turn-helix domain-containing protein [Candidatus Altiarchaeota archaeon]